MPPKADEGYKNLTLRLPDEYHRQLSNQSSRLGLTLNGHLVQIVQRHLMESGYVPGVIKSMSGRLFEIDVEPISQSASQGYFCSRFDVIEYHPVYTKRRAHYIFGLDDYLAGQKDPLGQVKDVGLALLNFYNRKGLEIDQLAWQTTPLHPVSPSPSMKDNWRYIGADTTKNIASFLISVARNHWKDDLLAATGQSQDIRCNLRKEDDLYR